MNVAICIPCHGDTRAQFTDSLAQLLIVTAKQAPELGLAVLMFGGSDLAFNRERLVEDALSQGADWILWLDSDQTFPPDTLLRLLSAQKPVIGCNYSFRSRPAGPVAQAFRDGAWVPVWTDEAKAKANEIERVDVMGLGVCLVHSEVFAKLARPWFRFERAGEDAYFFAMTNRAGIEVCVHHGLSWEVGHIGLHVYTAADATADKEQWLASRPKA
jgi:hypothetical protein